MNKIVNKIIEYKDKNIYLIFFSRSCGYSIKLLNFMKDNNLSYKGYDVDKIKGGFRRVLRDLNASKHNIGFDEKHITKPIVFLKGRFIGGADDTIKSIRSI